MFTLRSRTLGASLALLAIGLFPANTSAQVVAPLPGAPGVPGVNPGNPYGFGANPYTTMLPGNLGTNINNPYSTTAPGLYPGAYGGYPTDIFPYSGIAKIIDSQGQYWMSEEKARFMREKALQEHLETLKKSIELERWIRDTTPTFTEEQAKIAATILKRVQENATPAEIWSGRALNILKKDLAKLHGSQIKVPMEPLKLDKSVLKHLNVTVPNGGSLGLLRNEGRFAWPLALVDMIEEKQRGDIERNAQDLVSQAATGNINVNTLKDLDTAIQKIRAELDNKVLPARQYLQASRFLEDFQSAIQALETADSARVYFDYQRWAKESKDGRSAPEVVAWMSSRGLSFAPAAQGDEFAYEAMYSAMANYDVAFNTQLTAVNPKANPKDNK